MNPLCILVFAALACAATKASAEHASYKNPHPRPYDKCDANDLIKLSGCCNDVLAKLDDCKAGDLACECCALQSMDLACYSLCPGNPSTNFLSVLFHDCSELNDVNACNLPFKKVDSDKPKAVHAAAVDAPEEPHDVVTVKSQVLNLLKDTANEGVLLYSAGPDGDSAGPDGDDAVPARPKLNLVYNSSNATGTSFASASFATNLSRRALRRRARGPHGHGTHGPCSSVHLALAVMLMHHHRHESM